MTERQAPDGLSSDTHLQFMGTQQSAWHHETQ